MNEYQQSDNTYVVDKTPVIPANQSLPELTIKAIILSVILTIVLGAANAFLGLKVGMTISASIPAAVIAMGVLRFFRRSNVLENNIVQTAASAGEAMSGGIAFTVPALIILGAWHNNFHYWPTVAIAFFGGILGVVFAVPLRRAMFEHENLRFPEGTAIGSVLKASVSATSIGLKELVQGGIVGAVISFAQIGWQVFSGSFERWYSFGAMVIGGGTGFSPAVIAAGFIVGVEVAIGELVGIFIGWFGGVPIMSSLGYSLGGSPMDIAHQLWTHNSRFIGIGTMLVGGVWTIIKLLKPMAAGIKASLQAVRDLKSSGSAAIPRTERDIPITYVAWTTVIIAIPMFFMFSHWVNDLFPFLTPTHQLLLSFICLVTTLIIGFMCAAICAYMAGLVGSSSSPISGMALIGLIVSSFIIMAFLGTEVFKSQLLTNLNASMLAVIMCALITAIAAISNDTMQDLKAGQIVGATPWKQQIMLMVGVGIAALVIPAILQLLYNAYGFTGHMPRLAMDAKQALAAPQANLMTTVVQGVFSHNLAWNMLGIGGAVAVISIIIDEFLRGRGLRLPTLAVGLGIYLPLDATMPLVIGGVLSYLVDSRVRRLQKTGEFNQQLTHDRKQRGLLLACGLVAGSALMGVILAIPFVIKGSADALKLSFVTGSFSSIADLLSVIITITMCYWVFRVVCKKA